MSHGRVNVSRVSKSRKNGEKRNDDDGKGNRMKYFSKHLTVSIHFYLFSLHVGFAVHLSINISASTERKTKKQTTSVEISPFVRFERQSHKQNQPQTQRWIVFFFCFHLFDFLFAVFSFVSMHACACPMLCCLAKRFDLSAPSWAVNLWLLFFCILFLCNVSVTISVHTTLNQRRSSFSRLVEISLLFSHRFFTVERATSRSDRWLIPSESNGDWIHAHRFFLSIAKETTIILLSFRRNFNDRREHRTIFVCCTSTEFIWMRTE